ncbi:ATP-dependent RNA helicase [Bacillus thuringiensis serovar israelensis ATCC 35646]|nr:ATP-dependent RNA helicase [Bacillus thuringiensis serovar israelensis ATCC 35646]
MKWWSGKRINHKALVLTPTRELAVQVKEDITNIGRFKRINAAAVYGKSSFARQKLESRQRNTL